MSFTPSQPKKSQAQKEREHQYRIIREQFDNIRRVYPDEKKGVVMRVFGICLNLGEDKIYAKLSVREVMVDVIDAYITEYVDQSGQKTRKDMLRMLLRLESSIGRAIRMIRQDGAIEFNPETFHDKSDEYAENARTDGQHDIEKAREI